MKTLANANDRTNLLLRLSKVNPEAVHRWGKMTSHQMICHLHDSFQAATGEKSVSFAGNVFHRTVIKWIGLYVPLTWPRGVPTRPEMDQQIGGTPPAEFQQDLLKLHLMINRFAKEPRDFTWHPHPVFGELSTRDWLRWGYLHVDHHLRQFGV